MDVQFQGAYAEVLQKLQAALIAGDVPDLVLLDSPFVALFAKDGVLVPLDDFAADPENGLDMSSFFVSSITHCISKKSAARKQRKNEPLKSPAAKTKT